MVRRIFWMAAGVFLVGALLFGRHGASYLKTGLSRVQDSVRDNVPVGFEIERARKQIKDLGPEVKRNMTLIAREEVEIERLSKQIAALDNGLDADKQRLLKLKGDLEQGKETYEYGGRKFTTVQVKADLSTRFDRFKTQEATLAKLQGVLAAREKGLDAAKQKLEGMLSMKRQLEVDVENLEARMKMIEVAETTSEVNFDDSALSQTKQLVTDIRTRLDVSERLLESYGNVNSQIPVDAVAVEDVSRQIDEHFSTGKSSLAGKEKPLSIPVKVSLKSASARDVESKE